MRRRLGVMLLGFAVGTHGHTVAAEDVPFRDNFKTAKDGVTKGWLVKYPWPDKEDASQSWRTIAGRLVLSRNGHVIRVLHAIDFWSWDFWAGGSEVVYEAGPVHGMTSCERVDVRSGKILEKWPGDCRDLPEGAPGWVLAASGTHSRRNDGNSSGKIIPSPNRPK